MRKLAGNCRNLREMVFSHRVMFGPRQVEAVHRCLKAGLRETPQHTRADSLQLIWIIDQFVAGAQDRASPSLMGLASLGLAIGTFCGLLYSVLLLNAISGLDFLGLALFRLGLWRRPAATPTADGRGEWAQGGWTAPRSPRAPRVPLGIRVGS